MTESMTIFQFRRRQELRANPRTAATAVPTAGKGSRGNTAHLFLKPSEAKNDRDTQD